MVAPLLPEFGAAPLQAMARASMRHRVTWESLTRLRKPNGEYDTVWVSEPEEPCLLMMGGEHVAAIAAASGVKVDGTCRVTLGRVVTPGMRGLVRWTVRGIAQQRLVNVVRGSDLTNRLFGLVGVVDAELNA